MSKTIPQWVEGIQVFRQDDEPTLGADDYSCIWVDTDDSNKAYLVFRRGAGDQVKIEIQIVSPELTINNQTGTSYILQLSDAVSYVRCANANPFDLTVPPNVSVPFKIGAQIPYAQIDVGQVTVVEGSGVTVNGDKKTTGQYKGGALIKVDTDIWDIHGSIEA